MSKLSAKQLNIDGAIADAQIASNAAIAQSKISGLTTDLAGKVATSVEINGKALTANVTLNTDDISEAVGATNLWYTDARVQNVVDANYVEGLSISITESQISDLTHYTSDDLSTDLSALGNQTIGGGSSVITFGNDVKITGDLTLINGSIDQYNVTELLVEDSSIKLNSGVTGAPTLDAEITVERGTGNDVYIKWDETNDQWLFGQVDPDSGSVVSVAPLFSYDMPQFAGPGLKFDGQSNQFELNVANEYFSISSIPQTGNVIVTLASTTLAEIQKSSGATAIYLNGLRLKRQIDGSSLDATNYNARIKQGATSSDPAEIEIDVGLCSVGDRIEVVYAAIVSAE